MSKATEDLLGELHGAMATAMKKKLDSGEYTAADLGVIRQFLKDNGINADPEGDSGVTSLADGLPEDIDDSVIPMGGRR